MQNQVAISYKFVLPISFAKEHKHMLAHAKELMEYKNGLVANQTNNIF